MPTTRAASAEHGSIFDQAAYWLVVAATYFLVGALFLYSGKGKLVDDDGKAPAALAKQFEGTFIDTFPGVNTAWVILGVFELGVVLLILVSVVRGEFLPNRPKAVLLTALALGLLTFACLSFGQTSTGNNEGTASLYTYFASTAVIFLLVLRLPPNGPRAWLSARAARGT